FLSPSKHSFHYKLSYMMSTGRELRPLIRSAGTLYLLLFFADSNQLADRLAGRRGLYTGLCEYSRIPHVSCMMMMMMKEYQYLGTANGTSRMPRIQGGKMSHSSSSRPVRAATSTNCTENKLMVGA